jgi:hypothetical protein
LPGLILIGIGTALLISEHHFGGGLIVLFIGKAPGNYSAIKSGPRLHVQVPGSMREDD